MNKKMNKKKRIIIAIIACLLVVTGVAAIVHFATRDSVREGTILVEAAGKKHEIVLSELSLVEVEGIAVNGKGEEKTISGSGIAVADLLSLVDVNEYSEINVIADDEYSASVSADEIAEDGKVYLLVEDNQGRLVVFGDENSKRRIKNVVKIVVD